MTQERKEFLKDEIMLLLKEHREIHNPPHLFT